MAAHVANVSQVPTSSSGAVSYDVTFQLDQGAEGLKVGMSATAEVVVSQAEGVNVPTERDQRRLGDRRPRRQARHPARRHRARRRQLDDRRSAGCSAGETVVLPSLSTSGSSGASITSRLSSRLGRTGGLGGGGDRRRRVASRRRLRGDRPGADVALGANVGPDGPAPRVSGRSSNGAAPPRRAARRRPPAIILREVSKTYGLGEIEVRALRQVTLQIARGDFVAIMGSSGSGKSTLMNILGCLDLPTSGRYLIDGVDIRDLDEDDLADLRNRKIGFVFQSFNLVARTSALANVELPLAYAGVDRHARRERAQRALAAVGMAKRAHHQPSELSGGQQQRVAIARALVTNPTHDPRRRADREPRLALDRGGAADLRGLNQEGRTVVLITHEPDVAAQAKRVITLGDGRVIEDRRTAGVHDSPPAPQGQKSAHDLYGGAPR